MARSSYRTGAFLALFALASCGTPVPTPTTGFASRATSTRALPIVPATSPTLVAPTIPPRPGTPATPRPPATPFVLPTTSSMPVIATIGRGGIILELQLQKTTFAAGEGALATIIARNTGTDPALLLGGCSWAAIDLLDEQGQPIGLPEWSTGAISCPPLEHTLSPGAEERITVWFQLPPDAAGRHYTLQAEAGLGVPPPPGDPRIVGQPLTTPPLPLTVTAPTPDQRLRVSLEADRAGWRFVARDQAGTVPSAPHWVVIEAESPMTLMRNSLGYAPDGCWAGGWGDGFRDDPDAPITVQVWLLTPGYLVAAATQAAPPGSGVRLRPLGTPAAQCVDLLPPGSDPSPTTTP